MRVHAARTRCSLSLLQASSSPAAPDASAALGQRKEAGTSPRGERTSSLCFAAPPWRLQLISQHILACLGASIVAPAQPTGRKKGRSRLASHQALRGRVAVRPSGCCLGQQKVYWVRRVHAGHHDACTSLQDETSASLSHYGLLVHRLRASWMQGKPLARSCAGVRLEVGAPLSGMRQRPRCLQTDPYWTLANTGGGA